MQFTIQPNFKKVQAKQKIDVFLKNLDRAVLERLQFVGEAFIANCRGNANFKDRSGNLRSSIGYVVLKDGKAYSTGGFVPVKGGEEGATIGQRAIARIAKQYPQGWVIIGVAGMSYGVYVEARGFSVITPFASEAKAELQKAVGELQKRVA